jgi:hypothetical protein
LDSARTLAWAAIQGPSNRKGETGYYGGSTNFLKDTEHYLTVKSGTEEKSRKLSLS